MPIFGFHTTGAEVVATYPEHVEGRTFMITGPTAGSLAAQCAIFLAAAKPAKIILLGRTLSKVQPVLDKVTTISPTTSVHFIRIDLSSQASVRKAADDVQRVADHIDVMLNSAAVMALPNFEKSVDGIELQFSTNHLGHFLLTALIYPLFVPGSRIINVSSTGHCLGPINFPSLETINFNNGATYTEWGAYGQSKCANVLFSRLLAQKFQEKAKDIAAFSLHPGGIVGTGLEKHLVDPDWTEIFKIFDNVGRQRPKMKTLAEGTSTMLVACLDPRIVGHSGAYLDDCQVSDSADFAKDMGNAKKLWELSEKLVGDKFEI